VIPNVVFPLLLDIKLHSPCRRLLFIEYILHVGAAAVNSCCLKLQKPPTVRVVEKIIRVARTFRRGCNPIQNFVELDEAKTPFAKASKYPVFIGWRDSVFAQFILDVLKNKIYYLLGRTQRKLRDPASAIALLNFENGTRHDADIDD